MTTLDETRHEITPPAAPVPVRPRARVGLAALDRLALREFVTGEPEAWDVLLDQVNAWVHGLAEPEGRDEARMRLLARAIATQRAKCILLEAKRDEVLARRDLAVALALERLLDGTHRRLVALLAEHRQACRAGQRSVAVTAVAVGPQAQVNVVAAPER